MFFQEYVWKWFCFSLGSACKRKYFRLRCGSLLLVVVVLLVDHVCGQFVQAMRNSDTGVRIVFVTDSILISTPCLPCR